MKRVIIGTAGHIDHGKTALVQTLTGVDTDRLQEEKKRGISIELGFAPLRLPNGQLAGIVDVPGHERFIRQMLAGAFGVDLVLFVIAADEGIMPQTREHMDIVQLLGIEQGIVVLTKKDLVDEEWLMLVEEEIHDYVKGTPVESWPVIAVSSVTGENISELLNQIAQLAEKVKEKPAAGKTRLPIDRVFTMTGFGTVVTGTLWSGRIKVNDSLQILPQEISARVRTLQVHNSKVEEVLAGQRVAVNLQGIDLTEVKRGNVLVTPGWLSPSYRVNVNLLLLKSSPRPLKNWARIRFHLGTDEAFGRVVLLEHDELQPGDQGFVQIVLEKPVVSSKNDRFVIRFYSPVVTIGGGTIIDPRPPKQKRFNESVLRQIAIQQEGSPDEIVLQLFESALFKVLSPEEIITETGAGNEELPKILDDLVEQEQVERLTVDNRNSYISKTGFDEIGNKITGHLYENSQKHPLRKGILKEELRSKYFKEYPIRTFNSIISLLESRGIAATNSTQVMLPGEPSDLPEGLKKAIETVVDLLETDLLSPPGLKEIQEKTEQVGQDSTEILAYLEEEGRVIKVAEGMYFSAKGMDLARQKLNQFFDANKELALSDARDAWDNSRKYALPLLEYFDRVRFTKRMGDYRVRMQK
ncbi:MAG: selenocysteine-specific translation elongation factor [Chitinophagales bacterium]